MRSREELLSDKLKDVLQKMIYPGRDKIGPNFAEWELHAGILFS